MSTNKSKMALCSYCVLAEIKGVEGQTYE